MTTPEPRLIEVLLVEDDPGDVLLTREAFEHQKVANRLHVVNNGEDAHQLPAQGGCSTPTRPSPTWCCST